MRDTSTTFAENRRLPVHRWIRFSAGFSGAWAERLIAGARAAGTTRVFDPFAGSATTLLAAENAGVESCGVESHPFVVRMGLAKLSRRSSPEGYAAFAAGVRRGAARARARIDEYPPLIRRCFSDEALSQLDRLRRSFERRDDGSPAARLTWLTLVAILRRSSHAGTASWQYVLPAKEKRRAAVPFAAFDEQAAIVRADMARCAGLESPRAALLQRDARDCRGVPDGFATLVVTSPPYPNNFDYADATRLEMTFLREIDGWGDLDGAVRRHLVRSCSQHVSTRSVDLAAVLADPDLGPIAEGLRAVTTALAEVRRTRAGRKAYHLMIACYFLDLARVWKALRRVTTSPSRVCFVVGDSAPYGIHVPVSDWLGELALAAGFRSFRFEKTRARNVKWRNRKHRVPLCEGRLWVTG